MQCQMKVDTGRICNDYVFRCKDCKSPGCRNENCRNQGFDKGNGRCLRCGKTSALS